MPHVNEDAIREQAYYLWEKDGRPMGRDAEYWQRAVILATPKAQLDTLTKAPPVKAKAKAPEPKATVKVKAAATQSKTAPTKSVQVAPKKPKKK